MLFSKRRILVSVAALSAAVVLAGCSPTQDGDPSPPPQPQMFKAEFNPATARLPWPNDIFFGGTTDATLNLPALLAQYGVTTMLTELNTLDGYSTTAPMNTLFDNEIDGTSLSASTVHVIEVYLGSRFLPAGAGELPPGATSPVSRKLVYGTDFTAEVSPDYDSFGKILRITPLKPLRPSTGITNGNVHVGYYVLLTGGIRDVRGQGAIPDDFYAALKAAPADCSSFSSDPLSYGLCGFTKAHLAIGQAVGIDPASVAVSWGFTTQSVEDSFNIIAATVPAQPIGVVGPVGPSPRGHANIYVGTTQVPYYLTAAADVHDAAAVLGSYWRAAGPSPVPGLDPDSRNVTKYNPMPGKTKDVTIPLLVTVPNAAANGGNGCPKPAAGYPVAIFQHGIFGNRTFALAVADSFADACFIVAAIDQPLHGLTDTTNPLYAGPLERTFNVDVTNNKTLAPGPDGLVDASGQNTINLLSPLTSRDNLRQAEADLIVFTKSVANLDIDGGGPDVDPSRLHFIGHSLGGIVGGTHVRYTATRTATLANPGGVITRLLLDSDDFGPLLRAGLAANNVVDNSTLFNNRMLRDFQTVIDAGDPSNHICACAAQQPILMFQVQHDSTVPNNSTQRLVKAGNLRQISTAGANPVGPTEGVWVDFNQGDHNTLIRTVASPAATVEMQRQAVTFAASAEQAGGPFVVITDTSVIGHP